MGARWLYRPAPSQRAALPAPGGPLSQPVRVNEAPNTNPAVGSVGPNVPVAGDPAAWQGAEGGYGATHVMQPYPPGFPPLRPSPWAGWPVEWATPSTTSPATALDVIWSCLDKNSSITGSMPVFVTKARERIAAPSWVDNPQPEVYTSWADFWRAVWWSWQSTGEAFIFATSRFADTGYPRTFMHIPSPYVSPEIDPTTGRRKFYVNGRDETDNILQIRYRTVETDAHGHGPLEVAGLRATTALVLSQYAADLARNGGIPWAVLNSKLRITPEQAAAVRQQWIEAAQARMGAPAVLSGGDFELQALQTSPKDMLLAELQQHTESRLAVLLGVPPYLVGLPAGGDSLTYASTVSIFQYHWASCLEPGASFITRAISNWSLPLHTELNVDPSAYIKESMAVRGQFYASQVAIGAMTVDEVREAERYAPLAPTEQPQQQQPPPPPGQQQQITEGEADE